MIQITHVETPCDVVIEFSKSKTKRPLALIFDAIRSGCDSVRSPGDVLGLTDLAEGSGDVRVALLLLPYFRS